jgi:hypothetical protein
MQYMKPKYAGVMQDYVFMCQMCIRWSYERVT